MPEVGGDAAVYVDPLDIEDIKKKLKTVMGDKKMKEVLIKKGFERIKCFSWEKTAEQTYLVYKKTLKNA